MTFQDLEQEWRSRKGQSREKRREFWDHLSGPARGWFTACRTAVAEHDFESIAAWLNPADEDKQACLNFDTTYAAVARAHLLCAQAMLEVARPEEDPQVPDDAVLQTLAAQIPTLLLPLNWWRDVVHALHPLKTASPASASQVLRVLLVDLTRPQRPGVVAALTLDLLVAGSGALYPAVPMAFVQRDGTFRTAEHTVCTYFRNKGVWRPDWDVRWEITRLDEVPLLPLSGGSLGAALALGVAKLCALSGQVLCEGLRTLHIQQLTLTATYTATGELGAVDGLEAKFDAAYHSSQVRRIVVSSHQRNIQPLLNEPTSWPHILAAATLEEAVQHLAMVQVQTTDSPLVGVPPHLLQVAYQQLSAAQRALQAGEEAAPQKLRLALHAFGIDLDTPALVPGYLPPGIGMLLGQILREVSTLAHVPEATRHQVARLLEACYQPSQATQHRRVRVCLIAPDDVAEERAAAAAYVEELEKDPLLGWVSVEVVSWDNTSLAACDIVLVLCWSKMGRVEDRADSRAEDAPGQARHADAASQPSLLETVSQEAEYATRTTGKPRLCVYQRTERLALFAEDPQMDAKRVEWQQVQAFCEPFRRSTGRPYTRYTSYDTLATFVQQWAQHLRYFLADEASATSHPSDVEPQTPYRNLATFQPHEARYFRGREQEIRELQALVQASRFVTLRGPSGSGKSSLALAGVVPRLAPRGWFSAVCRPQLNAVGALSQAPRPLSCVTPDTHQQGDTHQEATEPSPQIEGRQCLTDHVTTLLQTAPEHRLLLIVDQFEELFRPMYDESQRRFFLQDLNDLVNSELPCCVLVTLRADMWNEVLSSETGRLLPAIKEHQMDLWPMLDQGLRQAIEEPAEEVGVTFEAGLVELIVEAVEKVSGQLTVLQIVLTNLFEKRRGRVLTHESYKAIGEISEAIANWADNVVDKLVREDPRPRKELEAQLEGIFITLVDLGKKRTSKATRRIATFEPLGERNRPMVKKLVESGLVRQESGGKVVEIAHDALIDRWPLMQQWIENNKAQLQLDTKFREWQENQLTLPMFMVPCGAAMVGAFTRPLFARSYGTFLSDPFYSWGSAVMSRPAFYGLVGTWLGSVLLIRLAATIFFERPGELRLRKSTRLVAAGVAWGGALMLLFVLFGNSELHAGWGYLLTGTCWGIGAASGTYLGDKVKGNSAKFLTSLQYRVVGAGIGTLVMLFAFVCIIGAFISYGLEKYLADFPILIEAHARVMERAWGEACEQSVSVWAFFGFFYVYLRKVYLGGLSSPGLGSVRAPA